jgi:uncharacterized protein (DUF488 family)
MTVLYRPVLTIGHSTRPIEEFLEMLKSHGVQQVVDVRTIPRSRHNPQFNQETLASSLRASKVEYLHIKALGGLRKARPDSVNDGWRNPSFRGFADYMQTEDFLRGMEQLLQAALSAKVTLVCAEAVPWRCHRSLIADALLVRGIPVQHIMTKDLSHEHELTAWARVDRESITYAKVVQD